MVSILLCAGALCNCVSACAYNSFSRQDFVLCKYFYAYYYWQCRSVSSQFYMFHRHGVDIAGHLLPDSVRSCFWWILFVFSVVSALWWPWRKLALLGTHVNFFVTALAPTGSSAQRPYMSVGCSSDLWCFFLHAVTEALHVLTGPS